MELIYTPTLTKAEVATVDQGIKTILCWDVFTGPSAKSHWTHYCLPSWPILFLSPCPLLLKSKVFGMPHISCSYGSPLLWGPFLASLYPWTPTSVGVSWHRPNSVSWKHKEKRNQQQKKMFLPSHSDQQFLFGYISVFICYCAFVVLFVSYIYNFYMISYDHIALQKTVMETFITAPAEWPRINWNLGKKCREGLNIVQKMKNSMWS